MAGRGYSLIELVLTILLISLIAVMATTLFPGRAVNLGAQAQQLAGDIRYVQSLSMTRGARHFINLQTSSYSFANASGAVVHPATGSTAPMVLEGVSLTAPAGSYAFDGKGAPYTSSGALGADATITLTDTASGQTRSVVITQQTGRVTVP
jgi:prepilin-type N-terminal cleavage/methylation domain-containing protein